MAIIKNFFSFLQRGQPAADTEGDAIGDQVTTLVQTPVPYLYPTVQETYELVATISVGTANTAAPGAAGNATVPAGFSDFPLAAMDFNPPLSSFSISKIESVTIRFPPAPRDCNWYAGIWATLPVANRDASAVRRRSPNVFWVWRSNLTVQQSVEHGVPWPVGRPISDSLHATAPGLHPASLQIGFVNQPAGTAAPLQAGAYELDVIIKVNVAGRGLFGNL